MKTSTVGLVSAAILMVVACVGFGIAQAGGNHIDRPVLSFEDQEVLEQGSSSSSYVDTRPVMSFEDQETTQVAYSSEEFVPEGNWSGTDWQAREPVETGSLPDEMSNADFDPFSRGGP